MASTPKNVRNLALGSASPLSPPPSPFVHPLFPPLPPTDVSQSPDSLKQVSEPAVWSEARPTQDANVTKYNHQHQCFLYSEAKKSRIVEETQSPSSRKVTESGRTIWSISPEELSELAQDMAVTRKESTEAIMKLSYADASKRCLVGSALFRTMQPKVVAFEQPIHNFKKYYGLPNIPSFEPLHSDDAEASEEKTIPFDKFTGTEADSESQDVMDNSQVFGLSATTPTFYPRQTADTNELIQMLKASLSTKKVAPHMDWWPGDWKCTNCGNHNFSYRETCKRCRVGRLEDAGFVFPTSSADSSS